MIKYTAEELTDILAKHAKWLKNNESGCRANLDRADLRCIDLNNVDLSGASLNGANLYRANLGETNLGGADLVGANLREANLIGANLKRTDLRYAELREASIMLANLELAELGQADLEGVDFSGANLELADLSGANLSRANLNGATSLINTRIDFPLACPDEGAFIGWKKCVIYMPVVGTGLISRSTVIVKLCILSDAKRSSATDRKCRCDRAEVLDIQDMEGHSLVDVVAYSGYDNGFTYKVGKVVSVDDFDDCRWHECAPGIHFFITRQEALDY